MKLYLVKIESTIVNYYYYCVVIGGFQAERSYLDADFNSFISAIHDMTDMTDDAILNWVTRHQIQDSERYSNREILAEGESLQDLIAPFPWALL